MQYNYKSQVNIKGYIVEDLKDGIKFLPEDDYLFLKDMYDARRKEFKIRKATMVEIKIKLEE